MAKLVKTEAVIARAEQLDLSECDSLRILDLLERPPGASARLVRAAKADLKARMTAPNA